MDAWPDAVGGGCGFVDGLKSDWVSGCVNECQVSGRALRKEVREEGWQGWVLKMRRPAGEARTGVQISGGHSSLARVTRRSLADGADHLRQGPGQTVKPLGNNTVHN